VEFRGVQDAILDLRQLLSSVVGELATLGKELGEKRRNADHLSATGHYQALNKRHHTRHTSTIDVISQQKGSNNAAKVTLLAV
jgi:hypothetical protein